MCRGHYIQLSQAVVWFLSEPKVHGSQGHWVDGRYVGAPAAVIMGSSLEVRRSRRLPPRRSLAWRGLGLFWVCNVVRLQENVGCPLFPTTNTYWVPHMSERVSYPIGKRDMTA